MAEESPQKAAPGSSTSATTSKAAKQQAQAAQPQEQSMAQPQAQDQSQSQSQSAQPQAAPAQVETQEQQNVQAEQAQAGERQTSQDFEVGGGGVENLHLAGGGSAEMAFREREEAVEKLAAENQASVLGNPPAEEAEEG